MRGLALAALVGWLLSIGASAATDAVSPPSPSAAITTVILVRHSEKAATPRADPPLTPLGRARSAAIAALLARAGVTGPVDAVFSSPYQRTLETARPLAQQAGLAVNRYDPRDSEALVARVLSEHAGGIVLVVGHSNTVPGLVQAFGGQPDAPPIVDDEYDNLYVLSVVAGEPSPSASVLRLTQAKPQVSRTASLSRPALGGSARRGIS